MDLNLYALERQVEMKLAEARAMSARTVLLSSLGAARGNAAASLFARITTWVARRRRHRELRRTTGLPTPSAP